MDAEDLDEIINWKKQVNCAQPVLKVQESGKYSLKTMKTEQDTILNYTMENTNINYEKNMNDYEDKRKENNAPRKRWLDYVPSEIGMFGSSRSLDVSLLSDSFVSLSTEFRKREKEIKQRYFKERIQETLEEEREVESPPNVPTSQARRQRDRISNKLKIFRENFMRKRSDDTITRGRKNHIAFMFERMRKNNGD